MKTWIVQGYTRMNGTLITCQATVSALSLRGAAGIAERELKIEDLTLVRQA